MRKSNWIMQSQASFPPVSASKKLSSKSAPAGTLQARQRRHKFKTKTIRILRSTICAPVVLRSCYVKAFVVISMHLPYLLIEVFDVVDFPHCHVKVHEHSAVCSVVLCAHNAQHALLETRRKAVGSSFSFFPRLPAATYLCKKSYRYVRKLLLRKPVDAVGTHLDIVLVLQKCLEL